MIAFLARCAFLMYGGIAAYLWLLWYLTGASAWGTGAKVFGGGALLAGAISVLFA